MYRDIKSETKQNLFYIINPFFILSYKMNCSVFWIYFILGHFLSLSPSHHQLSFFLLKMSSVLGKTKLEKEKKYFGFSKTKPNQIRANSVTECWIKERKANGKKRLIQTKNKTEQTEKNCIQKPLSKQISSSFNDDDTNQFYQKKS